MTEERLSGALQENILTVLVFDTKYCKLIRQSLLSPKLFESSVFRDFAGHAFDFIDSFGEPIADHLPDAVEHVLKGEDKRKAETYKRLIDNLYQAKDSVNAEYVVSQLQKFIRQQNLKSAYVESAEAFESGDIDKAELLLQKGLQNRSLSFDPGLNLMAPGVLEDLINNPDEEGFDLFIDELDKRGIIPRRKQLTGFIAPRGKGKSWFCTHVFKCALIQGWSPLVITLEMSEKLYGVRLLQSFFSISKRDKVVRLAKLQLDKRGGLQDIVHSEIERMTLKDEGIVAKLAKKARREFKRRPPFWIKSFPTSQLTVSQLKAYLNTLRELHNFTPDVIILDYPDLMAHDVKNKRLELGRIQEELRGVAVELNCAMIVPSQGNRDSETATTVVGSMAAEDISKLGTWDTCYTYSQTTFEYKLGLARIFVEKARNEESKQMILVTQAYAIGQFVLSSVLIGQEYWKLMQSKGPAANDEDEERPRRRRASGREED